ncbi:MAG TPA: monofunctional biosynthetic peptidoglycan transglycosylase [Xanthobacteraceae bacterium]|nr:monofunctional biosynthetic peptidoglycan transglycosylase [Xanthobacteraceae bacterium]
MLRALRIALLLALVFLAAPYVLAPFYRAGHPVSTLMIGRWVVGAPVMREWRDLRHFAPILPRTVIAAEDAKFCSHHGIDWDALSDAIDDAQDGGAARGASTITQQVAKNLFLWPGRSVIRKGLEIPLAMWLEVVLPKARIMELYLNIAEWGPSGQFGAEAGAKAAFGRPASGLSPQEAALLTAMLPNPVVRSAKKPSRGVRRRAGIYVARARAAAGLADCVATMRPARFP